MKALSNTDIAEWASKAGEAGAFLFDKYCQRYNNVGLHLEIDMGVGMPVYGINSNSWLRIIVKGGHGYRYVKSVYAGEELDIVQLICTMEKLLKEYNELNNHKRK